MIRSLDLRLSFLKTCDAKEVQHLQSLLQNIFASTEQHHGESELAYLGFDLLYCLLKHRNWIANPLFQHLLLHHLINDFRTDRVWAEHFLSSALPPLGQKKFHPAYAEERTFLLYLLVLVLNCRNPDCLTEEIGLGSSILRLIRDALTQTRSENTIVFGSTLTTESLEILEELAEDYLKNPSITNVYPIYFALLASEENWKDRDTMQLAKDIFEILLHIGQRKSLTEVELREKLEATRHGLGQQSNTILRFLKAQRFVFEISSTRRIQLTQHGYEQTADAYARKQHGMQVSADTFYGLHPNWQLALIETWPLEQAADLWTCLKLANYIPPRSFDLVCKRFQNVIQSIDWEPWLAKMAIFHPHKNLASFTEPTKNANALSIP